jgi:hypothetical protein
VVGTANTIFRGNKVKRRKRVHKEWRGKMVKEGNLRRHRFEKRKEALD